MNNIHNFANRQLCEYRGIFPNVAALLDHMFFVIGNGYDFDDESGMIYERFNKALFINEFPRMTEKRWARLIAECHLKEHEFAEQYKSYAWAQDAVEKLSVEDQAELDEWEKKDQERAAARLQKKLDGYKPVAVTDEDFSEDALYRNILEIGAERNNDPYWKMEKFYRPYPLHDNYSDIYNVNSNSPKWFVQIARNLCMAWVRFLNEELTSGHVWIKPSLRPKTQDQIDKAMQAVVSELANVKQETAYKEPEVDHADLERTTNTRNELVNLVAKLDELLKV